MAGDMLFVASLFFQKKVHNFIRTKKGSCIALTDFGKKHPISSNPILEKGKQQFGKKLTPLFLKKQLDPNKINPPTQGAHGGGGANKYASPRRPPTGESMIFCLFSKLPSDGNRARAKRRASAARIVQGEPWSAIARAQGANRPRRALCGADRKSAHLRLPCDVLWWALHQIGQRRPRTQYRPSQQQ